MNAEAGHQDDVIGTQAGSLLRQVHWWLAAVVLLLCVAIYFEPVTLGYARYSLMAGVVWFALTLITWRSRSRVLAVVSFLIISQAHALAHTLHTPYRPSISGVLISGVALFCLLLVARSRVRRFCRLS